MELGLILALGIVSYLFLYMSISINKEQPILSLIAFVFFLLLLILIPKVTLDYNDTCSLEVVNSTQTLSGNITTTVNNYGLVCEVNPSSSASVFMKIMMWFFRLVSVYAAIAIIVISLFKLRDAAKRRK